MTVTSALAGGQGGARHLLAMFTVLTVAVLPFKAPGLEVAVIAALVMALLAFLARQHTLLAAGVGLVVIGTLPVYAGRYIGGTQFGVTPTLVVAMVLAPAALKALPRLRVVPMDVAVGAFCLLRLASGLLNFTGGLGAAVGPALYLVLPYAVFRLLTLYPEMTRVATRAVVLAGAVAAVFAIVEHAGRGNPFYRVPSSGYEYGFFAKSQLRFGEIRAEAGFGHSIALGMFLALALLLAVALAVETRRGLARVALLAAAGLILQGTLATLSRGALLVLAVGVVLWLLLEFRRLHLSTVAGMLAAGAAMLLLTPVGSTVSQLVESSRGDTVEASSTEHRFAILDLVTDPAQFSVLGQQASGQGGITDQVEVRLGLHSFDNAFALVYLSNGLLAALAFLAVGVIAFRTLGSSGLSTLERAWVAGLSAATLNLLTVNLLTQYEDFYWIAAALSASAWQRSRHRHPARNNDLVRSPG